MIKKTKRQISNKQRVNLCQLLGNLIENGFSLNQAFDFFQAADFLNADLIVLAEQKLQEGRPIVECFEAFGFSEDQLLQIELGEAHGNLALTFQGISQQMVLMQKQRENFVKAVSYPALLVLFLGLILLGMRYFLLPQLLASGMIDSQNLSVWMIQHVPIIILFSTFFFSGLVLLWKQTGKRQNYLDRYIFLSRVPLVGRLLKEYYSAYFALEWGKLFDQGLELQQIIACLLATEKNSLMKELAASLQQKLVQGRELADQLKMYPFLTEEFSQIVLRGEVQGNLGKELLVYSQLMWQRFFARLEWLCSWLQPVIFLFVALLIISIYIAMLLPLSSGMEEIW
ncbi:competence protein ComGB [Enterococcus florum]|uniref:Competence protein ComGB n=1 Tax=Enterococcus florum TaxID=2480627 RepID=A0A4P5PFL8_9ENTE|nr:competence type IV pilus assembly protein ComGB [Enterococcus florum]GCF95048.1 competence protein ComGB [Enterococcus florum]